MNPSEPKSFLLVPEPSPAAGSGLAPARPVLQVPAPPPELDRVLLVANARPLGWISDKIAGVVESPTPAWWWWAFIPSVSLFIMLVVMVTYLISTGVGVWGLSHPVMWGWA